MISPQIARHYLLPSANSFWQWIDDGEAIAWRHGKTIVFRKELVHILEHLAPGGFPPFDAILLLLAACRENWRHGPSELSDLYQCLDQTDERLLQYAQQVVDGLDHIRELRSELRTGAESKAALVDAFFEGWQWRTEPEQAEAILRILGTGLEPHEPRRPPKSTLPSILNCVNYGLQRFDAEAFALRRRTGLEQTLLPASTVELKPAESIGQLLLRLKDDPELGGMVRLARDLRAAVTLPRSLAEPDELPLGGVSDISNHGALDKLLLSELAHDDLTLAVRVAVNEALYLRREAPPRTLPKQRAILVDAGLRMWGVPRVFATSVALAMAAGDDKTVAVRAYRARGAAIEPLDFQSREGIVEHLTALETSAHPGEALPALQRALSGPKADAEDTAREAVIVTGEDVWADRAFQAALSQLEIECVYGAIVTRDGRLRLLARTSRGSKLLREARLDLNELLNSPDRPIAPLVVDDAWLPALCKLKHFPLWLPYQPHHTRVWPAGKDVFGIAGDGRLLIWGEPARGAGQLTTRMRVGKVHWHDYQEESGITTAVVGKLSRRGLALVRINNNSDVEELPLALDAGHPIAVTAHQGMLFVVYQNHVSLLEMTHGQVVQSVCRLGYMGWHHGRVLRSPGPHNQRSRWSVLSHDGVRVLIQPVLDENAHRHLLTLLAPPNAEGCIGITTDFRLYHTATGVTAPIVGLHDTIQNRHLAATSRNGERVVITGQLGAQNTLIQVLVHVATAATAHLGGSPELLAELGRVSMLQSNLHTRFEAVGVDAQGHLLLLQRRGSCMRLEHDQQHERLMLCQAEAPDRMRVGMTTFGAFSHLPDSRIELRRATLPDGTRVVLDSRGLLHLKSPIENAPEVSLVLHAKSLGVWCADGRYHGPVAFSRQPQAPLSEILADTLQPLLEHARC